MELTGTTPNTPTEMRTMRGMKMAAGADADARAETQSKEQSAVARSAPTSLDLAAAKSRAWLMNRMLRTIDANIEFTVQQSSGEIVVQLLDKASGEMLRHFPIEAFPDVAAVLDRQQGALIRDSA